MLRRFTSTQTCNKVSTLSAPKMLNSSRFGGGGGGSSVSDENLAQFLAVRFLGAVVFFSFVRGFEAPVPAPPKLFPVVQ